MHQTNIITNNHKTQSIHTTISIALILTLFLCFVLPWLVILIKEAANQRNKKQQLNTPPGSMGFPLIGETLKFMKPHPSTSLGEFLDIKIQKVWKDLQDPYFGKPNNHICRHRLQPVCVEE